MKKGLKSCLFVVIALISLCIIGMVAMAIFHVCPPAGPWPMPPWCGENPKVTFNITPPAISIPSISIPSGLWPVPYLCDEADRTWHVRCKPAFSVIQQDFTQVYDKPMYQVPQINAGQIRIAWPCNVHRMSEAGYITALENEIIEMKKMGVNTISLRVEFIQDPDPTKSTFYENTYGFNDTTVCDQLPYVKMGTTFPPDTMAKIFKMIHENDLMVLLEFSSFVPDGAPALDTWRGNVRADDLDKFFTEYLDKMMPYVKVAQQENVEIIRIATEVEVPEEERIAQRNAIFRDRIIPAIRSEFSGTLTYGENVQQLNNVDFWDQLDYIGVDFYRAITDKNDPTVQELEAGIQKIFDEEIAPIQQRYNKPVFLNELGYESFDGSNRHGPLLSYRGNDKTVPDAPVDLQEQADLFQATFNVGKNIPWLYGYVIWEPGYGVIILEGLPAEFYK